MNKIFDCVIINGEVFFEGKIQKKNIGISKGKIKKIFNDLENYDAKNIIDARDKWVLPGVIDIHFHIRSPAFPERGTVESETKAAAKGGITTLFEMPISDPCASTPDVIRQRKEHFSDNSYINFGLIAAVGKLNDANLMGLVEEGVVALKVFTIAAPPDRKSEFDGLCFVGEGEIFEALSHAKKSNLVTIFHAESQELLEHFSLQKNKFHLSDPKQHNAVRPPISETVAIAKILTINSYVGAKIHIAHVTSKKACDLISFFQKQGQDLTAETCPHYLFKSEEDVSKHHAFGKINPPIRSINEQEGLWEAVEKNILTIVGSDHAAFTFDEKIKGQKEFSEAPPGTPGGELLFSLMMDAALKGRIGLEKIIKLLCENPAKRFALHPKKGVLQEGSDADLVIFDQHIEWEIKKENLETKGKLCAHLYYGDKIKGKIDKTMVAGEIVYDNGIFFKNQKMNKFINIQTDKENL